MKKLQMYKGLKEKFGISNLLLFFGLLITFVAVIYSIFTYGISHITSDVATSYILSKSIIENGSLLPKTWNSANGEIWFFNGEMMALPFNLLVANKPLARMLGSLTTVAITVIGVIWSSKRLFRSRVYLLIIPIFLLFLGNPLARDNDLYQVAYTFRMLWIIFCPTLLYEQLNDKYSSRKSRIVSAILLVVILCGMMVRGTRYLAEQTAPLVLTLVTYIYIYQRNWTETKSGFQEHIKLIRYTLRLILLVVVPSALGFGFYKYLSISRNLNESVERNGLQFVDSINDVYNNSISTITNIFECFGFSGNVSFISLSGLCNFITLFAGVLICFVVPILQIVRFKEESKAVRFYTIYAVCHNAILLLIIICGAKLRLPWLLSTIFVNIVLSGRYIYQRWFEKYELKLLLSICVIIAILLEALSLIKYSGNWKEQYDSQRNLAHEIISHGLEKGYASFWNSYSTEVYTDGKVEFAEVEIEQNGNNKAWYWLVDNNRYTSNYDSSFLMLSEKENQEQSGYIIDNFGQPSDMFVVPNVYEYDEFASGDGYGYTNMYIYVFDYDLATRINNGCHDGVVQSHEMSFNYCGEINDDGSYTLYNGGIVQGPYSDIQKGEYTITIEGQGLEKADFEIVDAGESDDTVGCIDYKLLSENDESLTYSLKIEKRIDTIDFRLLNNTESSVIIRDILVEKL